MVIEDGSSEDEARDRPTTFDLHTVTDERGQLTIVEGNEDIPFAIERIYYLHDVPADRIRGEHAHVELEQVMIAVHGNVQVTLETADNRQTYYLDDPNTGLYVPPMTWRELSNFSSDGVCLVLASEHYDENDYIHEYEVFRRRVSSQPSR